MKFFFKTLLPYIFMFFVNVYGFRYAFMGMTAPHDVTFIGGVLLIATLLVLDVVFTKWQISRFIHHYKAVAAKSKDEENNEQAPSA